MKIEQITKADHSRRVEPWHQKAVNDPTVQPFLTLAAWSETPAPVDIDWTQAYFMDEYDIGLLSVRLDHGQRLATLGLWVLGHNTGVSALLMRYAMFKLPKRYGITHLAFFISDANRAWRDQAMRVAGKWMWGREPGAVFDIATGRMVDLLHFKVPVEAIQQHRRRVAPAHRVELQTTP